MSNKRIRFRRTFFFDGKRYEVTGKSEEEVIKNKVLKIKALEEGQVVLCKETLVKDWACEFFNTYISGTVSSSTERDYESMIEKYITKKVGHLKLRQVRQIHLQKILNDMAGKSKSRILKVKQLLFRVFGSAVENGLITKNPASTLTIPQCCDGTHRSITDAERTVILRVANYHRARLYVKLMLYFGLRPGECAALQVRNVNLSKKFIKIDHSRRGENEVGPPKSDAGYRKIPVPDVVMEDIRIAIEGKGPFDFVVGDGKKMCSRSSAYRMWRNFVREMNIVLGCKIKRNELIPPYPVADDLVAYCLRHTYCTDLQRAGVPINVARELMGHSDISITSKIYTHFSEDSFSDAAQKINQISRDFPHFFPHNSVEKVGIGRD